MYKLMSGFIIVKLILNKIRQKICDDTNKDCKYVNKNYLIAFNIQKQNKENLIGQN